MVGIVVVSHSKTLADGVVELAMQMVQDKIAIATAGGIADPDNPFGTDPLRIQQAIETVYSNEGVIVLMDLGSALLSAEVALELLGEEKRANVVLCEAPLVEGTLAASVQAMIGGSLAQVLAEARGALSAKAEHLGVQQVTSGELTAVSPAADTLQLFLTVTNKNGLHARPAAQFVTTANQFEASIRVLKAGKLVNAKSINQVAGLNVRQGDEIEVQATGVDAATALEAIAALAANNFGEAPEAATVPDVTAPTAVAGQGQLIGVAASPGMAIGPAYPYRPRLPAVETRSIDDPDAEWGRLEKGINAAKEQIRQLHEMAKKQVGEAEALIFQAHMLFLQDPDWLESAWDGINGERINAEAAWQKVFTAAAGTFRTMDDAYMRARAADIEDVGARVLRELMGVSMPALDMREPSILLAVDLTPSDTARLDPRLVLGICTEQGGVTSHSAILSRALGLPAVVGVGDNALLDVATGQQVAVNGHTGEFWKTPSSQQVARLQQERLRWQQQQQAAKASSQGTAVTQDGKCIEVAANIGGPNDVATALEFGAEGVGLFRTEFLFLDRQEAPSEEEQYVAYGQVVRGLGGKPLIIRTLDVGGDKPLPYLDLGHEENPFLGWRGIRFCLDKPEVFRPQLRAILRASVDDAGIPANVKIMFPMIGSLVELRRARAMLAAVQAELGDAGIPFDPDMEVGVMIEVPSAVAVADLLAREVDFFSIGTNDLTQYVMAADRGNARVAELAQALQPAVLRMIKQTVQAAHAASIWVGMCGELAGNALALPLLLGLGLDELSMSAPSLPAVKAAIRKVTIAEAEAVAAVVLEMDSAAAVSDYLLLQ